MMSRCHVCKYNGLDWYDEPCDSCTMGGETNHFEPIDNRPDTVSRKLYEQVVWERDTAISQLRKLGYGLGEEVRNNEWNNHTVACLLCDMFGDSCACNYNDIDEWLPLYCDFAEMCPPRPDGVACWEQFLKYREIAGKA